MSEQRTVNIYTDGSCINNGKSNATASIGVWIENYPELHVSEPLTTGPQTNQVAELRAIERALDVSDTFDVINIFTDSKYAMNCITVWCVNWERNGWKSSRGKAPTNMQIIKEVIQKLRYMKSRGKHISFTYVPGHSGDAGNEGAHSLAMRASMSVCGP